MTALTARTLAEVIGLTAVATIALGAGFSALLAERGRRAVLARLRAPGASRADRDRALDVVLRGVVRGRWGTVARWLDGWVPRFMLPADATTKLMPAGLHHPAAPVFFAGARLACALVMPLLVWLIAEPLDVPLPLAILVGVTAGFALPEAFVARLATRRQARLRAAIPDALDLLVVCLEAGVSLDAALLRVARDLGATYPDLAGELSGVNGRIAAGIPRTKR